MGAVGAGRKALGGGRRALGPVSGPVAGLEHKSVSELVLGSGPGLPFREEQRCRMAPAAESPAWRGHGVGGAAQAVPGKQCWCCRASQAPIG